MSVHSDPDDLALRALGEEVDVQVESHVATCAQCQHELEALRAVVATARTVEPEDSPMAPPPAVWDAVVAELGLGAGASSGAGAGAGARAGASDELAQRRSRRSRLGLAALTAAAVVLGIAVGAAGAVLLTGDDDEVPATVVAEAQLAALPEHEGTGEASVRGGGDQRVLELDVSDLSKGSGFYEVWLLDENGERLVSLGLLEGTHGTFPIPAAVDVAEFPVVDVSIEPADGDPAHSGDSVVRGVLSS